MGIYRNALHQLRYSVAVQSTRIYRPPLDGLDQKNRENRLGETAALL